VKGFLGVFWPFTLWLQSWMIEITPATKSPSDQFLRPVSPIPASASHCSDLNPHNSRYSSKNAARPVASCCTALRGILLSYVNQPFPCIPQITSAGHAIDWEAIGRACLQAGRTPPSDDMALYTTSNILRGPRGVHDGRGDSTSPVFIPL